jgi:hypothetical protein
MTTSHNQESDMAHGPVTVRVSQQSQFAALMSLWKIMLEMVEITGRLWMRNHDRADQVP